MQSLSINPILRVLFFPRAARRKPPSPGVELRCLYSRKDLLLRRGGATVLVSTLVPTTQPGLRVTLGWKDIISAVNNLISGLMAGVGC